MDLVAFGYHLNRRTRACTHSGSDRGSLAAARECSNHGSQRCAAADLCCRAFAPRDLPETS